MRRFILAALTASLIGGAQMLAPSPASGAERATDCGGADQPPCPPAAEPRRDQRSRPADRPAPRQAPSASERPRRLEGRPPAQGETRPPRPPRAEEIPREDRRQPRAAEPRRRIERAEPPPAARRLPPAAPEPRREDRRPRFDASRPPPPVTRPPVIPDDRSRWTRGYRVPPQYLRDRYAVENWRLYNLPRPPAGHRWYCRRGGDCFLVVISTGVIRETYWRADRDRYWRNRYTRIYRYDDDYFYRECRRSPDPAGVIIGGLIGGLLGGALSGEDQGGAVFAGIIIGAAMGAVLTEDMDCGDLSYAYRTYYDGLNSGVPGAYHWDNPYTRHRGTFHLHRFYYDRYGFYCADYSQTIWRDPRRAVNGVACRQPNGAWVFLR